MFRIDVSSATNTLPTPGAIGPNPDSYFTNGNPATPVYPTVVSHDFLNAIQEEMAHVIETCGIVLDKNNPHQLQAAIQYLINTEITGTILQHVSDDPTPALGGNLALSTHTFHSPGAPFQIGSSISIGINATKLILQNPPVFTIAHPLDTQNHMLIYNDLSGVFVYYLQYPDFSQSFGISSSGMSLFGGATVTQIDDDTTLAANSATRMLTQHAAKTYTDTQSGTLPVFNTKYIDIVLIGPLNGDTALNYDTSGTGGNAYSFGLSGVPCPGKMYIDAYPDDVGDYVFTPNTANHGAYNAKTLFTTIAGSSSLAGNVGKVECWSDVIIPSGPYGFRVYLHSATGASGISLFFISGTDYYASWTSNHSVSLFDGPLIWVSGPGAVPNWIKLRFWFN